jgi:hypothetical protein
MCRSLEVGALYRLDVHLNSIVPVKKHAQKAFDRSGPVKTAAEGLRAF